MELEATADCASLMWEDAIWMEPSDACGSVRALRQRRCKRGWQCVLNRVHAESKRRMCVPHKRIVPSSGVTSASERCGFEFQ